MPSTMLSSGDIKINRMERAEFEVKEPWVWL